MRYYLVDDDPDQRYEDLDELLDACVTPEYFDDDDDNFREWLDENNRTVEICGYEWEPSEALLALDEDRYCRERWSWAQDMAQDERDNAVYEANHTAPGWSFWICGCDVYVHETDDEEPEEDEDTADNIMETIKKAVEETSSVEEEDSQKEMTFESMFQCLK